MGYAGGSKPSPTYHALGDHTETLQIDFDPSVISYAELLALFWANHAPTRPAWKRQYRSMVMTHGDEQQRLALAAKSARELELGQELHTEILPSRAFHLAEDYHQKYYLRRVPALTQEFERMYPAVEGLVASTAAARVNGYLGGHGDRAARDRDLERLGLSAAGVEALLERVRPR